MSARVFHISQSARIPAPPQRVYDILADYRIKHPQIVPPNYFTRLEVEQGGYGAGTRTRITMRLWGMSHSFGQVVSEPEPGRVLVETNTDGRATTTFTMNPADEGRATDLTIATEFKLSGIFAGLQRWLITRSFSHICREELALITAYVRQ